MTEVNGWYLPGRDTYFAPFLKGQAPKKNGFQREHLLAAFDHVKEWYTAIDVGAYVGFWTLDMAERFGTVFAFEPAPDSYECLCKNMAAYSNVVTTQAAVGHFNGECSMTDDPIRMAEGRNVNTGSRFVDEKGKGTPMLTLDALEFARCDLLKIDVEGYEPMVLAGAENLIRRFRPVIIMECDKRFGSRFHLRKFAARSAVMEMGYEEVKYTDAQGRNALRPDRIFIPT